MEQDVGQAILESYSRILESLANTVSSRIEDVLHADGVARNPSESTNKKAGGMEQQAKKYSSELQEVEYDSGAMPMTLSDFMGWSSASDQGGENKETAAKMTEDGAVVMKDDSEVKIPPPHKYCYIEKVENVGGLRSPTARD